MTIPHLIVFSHLRWAFVQQRPQHLMRRLAGKWQITFVEEPVHHAGEPFMKLAHAGENLRVLVPHTQQESPGFHADQMKVLRPLLADWVESEGIDLTVALTYTPMALPLAQALQPLCLVYDCMDELSAFKDAPLELRAMERALMQEADLVLTGGPSLYEARRTLHPNVHCIPSSVDADHFSPENLRLGSRTAREVDELQGRLVGPRLGYFGVVDERMDLELLAYVADQHTDWQLVMVGPVVKIDPQALPKRANIHWLGMQPYDRLPYFLAGWDICLMPFALNDATHYISPTKTLEYMAGDRPIVSTAINDVVTLYGEVVEIAYTPHGFVRSCERLLAAPEAAREVRSCEMRAIVSENSWDRSAMKVDGLLWKARQHALTVQIANELGTRFPPLRPATGYSVKESRYR